MKTNNFAFAVFVVRIMHFYTGNDVMNFFIGLSGASKIIALMKAFPNMRLR